MTTPEIPAAPLDELAVAWRRSVERPDLPVKGFCAVFDIDYGEFRSISFSVPRVSEQCSAELRYKLKPLVPDIDGDMYYFDRRVSLDIDPEEVKVYFTDLVRYKCGEEYPEAELTEVCDTYDLNSGLSEVVLDLISSFVAMLAMVDMANFNEADSG